MRLERLEINGFKSFSDRSELAFDKGVTAIVGPNGCGKSNVADAITWVMGEQSAKSLRGERMEDVIFSGSDARKPTASAEVRLRFTGVLKTVTGPTFEDPHGHGHANGNGTGHHAQSNGNGQSVGPAKAGPYSGEEGAGRAKAGPYRHVVAAVGPYGATDRKDETVAGVPAASIDSALSEGAEELIQSVAKQVEVTRRLYRSGESEYLIDGQVCRLRDVHELLMDTGLGAKAYAIIEQGKIGLILSSRPTDRRQLIEEAAGVTKYKARRRAAELKLEAARQNLLRVDDIVFEVDRQRGALKRQAAKARRYQKLRDEQRRWERVLYARKYRQLADAIDSARTRLTEAREREAAAAARVAEVEVDLARVRIDLVEAESRATSARETAHARELAISRLEQQIAFDRQKADTLEARGKQMAADLDALRARREPAQIALAARRAAAAQGREERDRAAASLAADCRSYESAHREIEGLEADVEAARSEVFSAINSATALRHALEHAAAARDRVADALSRLDVEMSDARVESDRVDSDRRSASDALRHVQHAMEAIRITRTARDSELASARIEHEWRAQSVRAREHELAALEARLKSLEELEAARTAYGDAARTVLAQANGKVAQKGAIADYLEVEAGYERAVEAYLGDLLQHVVVEQAEQATAGLRLVRDQNAGRCGFLIASTESSAGESRTGPMGSHDQALPAPGTAALSSVVRVNGPFANAIRQAMGDACIAESFESAALACRVTPLAVATRDGDVFRGPHVLTGGGRTDARGILETKREIRELHDRIDSGREALRRLAEETASFEATIVQANNAIAALDAEQHRHEKSVVGYELQLQRATDDGVRLAQKREQLEREHRQAEEERDSLDGRQQEARASIARLSEDQRAADERLTAAQRKLFEAREAAEDSSRRAAEAGAAHAALVERAAALASEVERLEEAAIDLEARSATLTVELDATRYGVEELGNGIASGANQLDEDVRALEGIRLDVQKADAAVADLRDDAERHEVAIKEARTTLEAARATVADLDVARATSESDLSHLAASCLEAVQATLDEVIAEVDHLERDGTLTPDAQLICEEEPDDPSDAETERDAVAAEQTLSAEDAIARLRAKIDRLGPVNMMAIEQFDELETRHAFLVTQRKDLVDSIEQTSETIKRIDETTRRRFAEAFTAINHNFQETFSTLFGGGRAGLTLLDETDPLESGIEIIAQPPGKRLQSVQLLSGGEKALTAIALMFGLFKYKPSPFCLLDEIDAPLDDANIGRFVEMLRGMQERTQFILITHNRKTMEIADRLYGVTMEEPGVSKLISVQLN